VNILNEKARGEFVGTPHAAFINCTWKYAERRISEAIFLISFTIYHLASDLTIAYAP